MSVQTAFDEGGTTAETRRFPPGFLWGAATAAYQVEGSTAADGRTPSIWDTFSAMPGRVAGGDTGEPAADHYRRMPQDVALMRELGLGAYRFSLSWPRVRPDGGPENPAGLDFYDRLVDELLAAGITPVATLYHWDLPQKLEDLGGWTARGTAHRFADYAESAARRLGDRVPVWSTLNEPWCSAFLGYGTGVHAPGRTSGRDALAAAHHLLLAHGLGMQALRAHAPSAASGITVNLYPVFAADPESAADQDAARRIDGLQNRLFLDPVLRGRYPEDVLADVAEYGMAEHIQDGDLAVISAPVDFVGVNFYRDWCVSAVDTGDFDPGWPGSERVTFRSRGLPVTASGWEVRAAGLTECLVEADRRYPGMAWYVNENGAAYDDTLVDGTVDDAERLAYLRDHVVAAHAAIEAGVDLRGYFYWSFLDNFEWAHGYAHRFGLVHVDYATQTRTPKSSARWYSRLARANAVPER
ncbi:GH1 family beta-glucosidase [Actinokineospora sp. UTMC 2448]|uniref:GH1 family beta-glucosidase n=1 Tax=Actinokineospora sp. UTMC 2448 TaxID=2268449 RepID=UPI0021645359|nr:GH1 family beta-glucosidase [Actinokineospora sp. UTMC 2448]